MGRDKRIVWIAACALAGLLIAFGGVFSASAGQQNTNGNANTNAGGMNSNSNSTSRNANSNASMSADAKFMMTAAQGGLAEVAAARVALERASSDSVKQFAQ